MTEIIGYIAAFLTTISFAPQAIKTIKSKDTSGISALMYATFVIGVFFWMIYGILLQNLIITIANVITLILAGIVLAIKVKNIHKIKK